MNTALDIKTLLVNMIVLVLTYSAIMDLLKLVLVVLSISYTVWKWRNDIKKSKLPKPKV